MTSQTIKAALSRLARFETNRVYSYSYGNMINGRRIAAKRAGVYKVGK
jgi:hypothetical protein